MPLCRLVHWKLSFTERCPLFIVLHILEIPLYKAAQLSQGIHFSGDKEQSQVGLNPHHSVYHIHTCCHVFFNIVVV